MFKLVLEKAKESEIKLPTSAGWYKKQESSRKTSTSASLPKPKPLTVCVTTNREKFFKRWEYQTTWPASWETCMQVEKQQLELNMEKQTGSKLGKECIKAVFCHPAHLTNKQHTYIMQNARLDEAQAGIKITRRNINNLRYADDTALMAESEEKLKNLLMKVKEESEKVGLKLSIQKTKITAPGPITSWQINWENNGNSDRLYFWGGSKSLQMATAAMKLKDACSLEEKLWPT